MEYVRRSDKNHLTINCIYNILQLLMLSQFKNRNFEF